MNVHCDIYKHNTCIITGATDVNHKCHKGSTHSIAERRVLELIPVLGSQPAGDVSHKPGGRLPLLSARPAVTPATFKRAATNFAVCTMGVSSLPKTVTNSIMTAI